MTTIHSNLSIYLAIAEDAVAESVRLADAGRTPKANGQAGYIITFDPERRTFKQSLIAIAFAGMYLEALLSFVGTDRLGKALYNKIDRQTTYEEKLRMLGVLDQNILTNCKRFREARNDLMHEKAVDLAEMGDAKLRWAQEEARFAVEFVKSTGIRLQSPELLHPTPAPP